MWRANNGGLLIEVKGGSANLDVILKEMARPAGDVNVKSLKRRGLIKIKDLNEWTDKEELFTAIIDYTNIPLADLTIINVRKGCGGVQISLVLLLLKEATKLADAGHLRVGLVCSRVWVHDQNVWCFRCLALGHVTTGCTEPTGVITAENSTKQDKSATTTRHQVELEETRSNETSVLPRHIYGG